MDANDTLEFTTSNWATPQTVTVTAIDDVDDTDDVVALTFAAVGGEYEGTTAEYAVTVVDDDRGIVFTRRRWKWLRATRLACRLWWRWPRSRLRR